MTWKSQWDKYYWVIFWVVLVAVLVVFVAVFTVLFFNCWVWFTAESISVRESADGAETFIPTNPNTVVITLDTINNDNTIMIYHWLSVGALSTGSGQ